ncbi:ABC transporter substrate-binding protein [Lentibacillus populi]|uniref:ABC transporter substrate-binding protein n=1 Tax=Lentibacillus populi TaxID=1827502 RepID=A0A9W5U0A3_9BACI|nr:TRAP transporter substrate-binding protein DctP [Lentibacillus populi]GGB53241.1 ABC transporter substrate-binding protein [Lentibacillus populi]
MKRRSFFITTITLVVLLLLSGCLSEQTSSKESGNEEGSETFNWKMSSTYTSGSIQFDRDERFVELVNELSGGRLNITLHQAGELTKAGQLMDTVSDGTIEIGGDWPGTWAGKNPAFSLLGTSAAGFSAFDYGMWIQSAEGQKMYNEIYGQFGLVYFPYNLIGTESGIRSNEPIDSIEDLEGLNIRFVGTVQSRLMQEFGGNPVNIPSGELYQGMQRGVIDAFEFSGPAGDKAMNLDEVAKYVATPSWHQTASVTGVMINKEAWESLPKDLQKVVKVAAKTTMLETTFDEMYKDATVTNEMVESGDITVTEFSEKDVQKIIEVTKQIQNDVAKENLNFAKVLESQKKFMETYERYREIQGDWGFGSNAETLLD